GFVGAGEALTGQGVEVFAEFPQLPDTVVTSGVGQQVQHERADVGVDVGDPFQHVVTVFVGVAAVVAVDVLVEDDAAPGLVDDADTALGGVVVDDAVAVDTVTHALLAFGVAGLEPGRCGGSGARSRSASPAPAGSFGTGVDHHGRRCVDTTPIGLGRAGEQLGRQLPHLPPELAELGGLLRLV